MSIEYDSIEIFKDKKLSDLFGDIYNNSTDRKTRITELIDQIKIFIVDMDSALVIVPMLKDYLDAGIKNDDLLNKLGAIVARLLGNDDKGKSGGLLSEADKEELERIEMEQAKVEEKTNSTDKKVEENLVWNDTDETE